jgi:uncharacterized membrane protein
MNLPVFPQDKLNHFAYGQVIFAAAYVLTMSAELALAVSAVAGVLKEVADYVLNKRAVARGEAAPHGVEVLDAVATAMGGLVPFVLLGL